MAGEKGRQMNNGARTAVVTGAAGGMGQAIVERLSSKGVQVVAVDIQSSRNSSPGVHCVTADLGDVSSVADIVYDPLLEGKLDYLVNAAGVAWWDRDGSALRIGEDVWSRVLEVNFHALRRLCIAAVPLLRRGEGKAIVNIASIAGLRNLDSTLDSYQVSKAAVVSLSRSLAQQLGPEGIRCNTVCPGAVLTPMTADLYEAAPERRERMEGKTPLRRLGRPADIASAVEFLLSDGASFITGIDLVVDGGWTIQTL